MEPRSTLTQEFWDHGVPYIILGPWDKNVYFIIPGLIEPRCSLYHWNQRTRMWPPSSPGSWNQDVYYRGRRTKMCSPSQAHRRKTCPPSTLGPWDQAIPFIIPGVIGLRYVHHPRGHGAKLCLFTNPGVRRIMLAFWLECWCGHMVLHAESWLATNLCLTIMLIPWLNYVTCD